MAWWKFGKRRSETATAKWVGEELAKIVYSERFVEEVRERHNLPPNDPKPFVALAALSFTGVRIALNQKLVVTRVDAAVIDVVHRSFCCAAIWNYGNAHHLRGSPSEWMVEVMQLANKITDAFYANAQSKPPKPLPHWFACKEMIAYLQGGEPASNPDDIMSYSDILSIYMRTTKIFIEELLARNVHILDEDKP